MRKDEQKYKLLLDILSNAMTVIDSHFMSKTVSNVKKNNLSLKYLLDAPRHLIMFA